MSSSSEAFEYAIKKDVRNNPIVREVDERRIREQRRLMALGLLFVAVLLFSGWQRVELLQHGYRLEQMQQRRSEEEEANRHLRLEIETLRAPQRIEALATKRLRLVAPEPGSAIVIERVVPPDPPPPSVIARSDWSPAGSTLDQRSGGLESPDSLEPHGRSDVGGAVPSGLPGAEARDERSRDMRPEVSATGRTVEATKDKARE
jgi:cell division protein FtsL